jgi:hypothetical protein
VDPLDVEADVAKKGRGDTQGMDRRADIMEKAGKGERLGSGATPDHLRLLHHEHASP